MPNRISTPIIGAVLVLITYQAQADTYRCNRQLVSSEATTNEVLEKCGEPADRLQIGSRETLDNYGFRYEVRVEEWIYGPEHGMYHFLRFEGNRLKQVDSRRGNR
ncbi:DUF2845 domain-containing protein [Azomonas macrocytogenes]|uniref:DUF2845 domain-containing protein n=1 Tax=Azomonas macrocytogenes TaxID=69962 RepID=A0A839T3Z1_AZOMA|nr:DUF2845 domain-containing protein [Azomonas macrocytogenes]MBB3104251.1 hypothetical protein [Azomonas macrocytogenes]